MPTTPRVGHDRLVTPAFVAVTLSALVFFMYIGMVLVVIPTYVEDELAGGELGIGLTIATFAAAAVALRPQIGRAGDAFGRRRVMMVGAVVAGAAGIASGHVDALWQLLICRAVTGVGEAAMFIGAATLIADLSPAHRRAEAASYFSVAVYTGLGLGPTLGETLLDDGRYTLVFTVAGMFALASALVVLTVPSRVDRRIATAGRDSYRFFHRAATWPGIVLAMGMGSFAVFTAFIPDRAREAGLSGAGGLFLVYSIVCLSMRIVGAKWPERWGAGRSVTFALTAISGSLAMLGVFSTSWVLWLSAATIGVGAAFLYPSLMALVVNSVDDDERSAALSSFTMYFELGAIIGGLGFGLIGELLGKSSGFVAGAIVAGSGVAVLWRHVADPRAPKLPPPTLDQLTLTAD